MSDNAKIAFTFGGVILAVLAFAIGETVGELKVARQACIQQGFTSGTYEGDKVICSQIVRTELGAK